VSTFSKQQFKQSPTILKAFGINIPKLLTSPNALKPGGITTVIKTSRSIGKPDSLKTGKSLKGLSKELNMFFSTIKLMKLPTRNANLGNS